MSFALGKKLGMTRIFDKAGNHVAATLIQVGPCWVTLVRSKAKDGYTAVQIGFEKVKEKALSKAEIGHLKKQNLEPLRHLCEFRIDDVAGYNPGDVLGADRFQEGQLVDVIGYSKGRGFAGVFKKHGFHGPNASHGTHEYHRHPGSVGAHTDPGRIWKGQRMPGRMGNIRVTARNLDVVKVDPEHNLLMVRGAVPGARNGLVEIVVKNR